jgi:hypothetical protein
MICSISFSRAAVCCEEESCVGVVSSCATVHCEVESCVGVVASDMLNMSEGVVGVNEYSESLSA